MTPLLIECQHGLGDNINARPFIRAMAERRPVFVATPWPELFTDLPVRFVVKPSRLRTQAKNIDRQPATRWESPPPGHHAVRIQYGHASIVAHGNIPRAIESLLPLQGAPFVFDLPDFEPWRHTAGRPIAFVRPVTTRKEWCNTARNPLPQYVNAVAAALMETHHVIAVADLEELQEWHEGELPPYHTAFLHGELNVVQMLSLLRASNVAVGGVGFIVPASIALKTRAFIIGGGQAQHNAPKVITDPRMDFSRIHFVTPIPQCSCASMNHNCPKMIKGFEAKWNRFSEHQGLASPLLSPIAL